MGQAVFDILCVMVWFVVFFSPQYALLCCRRLIERESHVHEEHTMACHCSDVSDCMTRRLHSHRLKPTPTKTSSHRPVSCPCTMSCASGTETEKDNNLRWLAVGVWGLEVTSTSIEDALGVFGTAGSGSQMMVLSNLGCPTRLGLPLPSPVCFCFAACLI